MKNLLLFVSLIGIVLSCKENKISGELALKKWSINKIDSVIISLQKLDSQLVRQTSQDSLKSNFNLARTQFKHVESIIEYYFQGLTKRINGPALPDIKVEDGQVWPPHGFQVIEQLVYEDPSKVETDLIQNELQLLITDLNFIKSNLSETSILPRHVAELLQQELIRITSLGITGFDSPIAFQSIHEAYQALEGMRQICDIYYGSSALSQTFKTAFASTLQFDGFKQNFDDFDRLAFIKSSLIPLSIELSRLYNHTAEDSAIATPISRVYADWAKGKGFNPDFYVNYEVGKYSLAKQQLGARLFSDKQLSKTKNISCATCHQSSKYFTDGEIKATNFIHGGTLSRNSPTLLYAALQSNQFYDMRSVSLEDQIFDVMHNESEFNLSPEVVFQHINKDSAYMALFKKAYPEKDSLGSYDIRNAIATYVRSLSPFSSRLDQELSSNKKILTDQELKGFNIFMGKGKCGTCHFFPLFNGTVPPFYSKSESEIIGVPSAAQWSAAKIDPDLGRYGIHKLEELKYSFKTPTVRNAEHTAPYMHNGVYNSLAEVIRFYEVGGAKGIGISLPNQTLPFDNLKLNSEEKEALIAFIKTLSDNK